MSYDHKADWSQKPEPVDQRRKILCIKNGCMEPVADMGLYCEQHHQETFNREPTKKPFFGF